jgi:hypothetical protein
MLRVPAVQELLLSEVAGLARVVPEEGDGDAALRQERLGELRAELDQVQRKALGVVVLCATTLVVLLLTHRELGEFLTTRTPAVAFTLSVLAVAVFAGFRLGQWEKYRAVARVVDELAERQE